MNMMPGFAPVDNSRAAYEPSLLPYSFRVNIPKGTIATVFNGANEPIGELSGTTHLHLTEMIRIIEVAFRAEEKLSEVNRYYANRQQREAGRF